MTVEAGTVSALDHLPLYKLFETFLICCERGNISMIRLILDNSQVCVNTTTADGSTALLLASFSGQMEAVRILLEANADANIGDNQGFTPLHIACKRGWLDIVRMLVLEGKANTEARSRTGLTALRIASQEGRIEIVRFLNKEGNATANTEDKEGFTPLHIASKEGNIAMVELLVEECGGNIDTASRDGLTPLGVACQEGNSQIVRYLIKRGVAVDEARGDQLTPLLIACQKGNITMVKLLVEEGHSNPMQVCKSVITPLFIACGEGHVDVIRYLMTRCTKELTAETCLTPFLIACRHDHAEAIQFFMQESGLYDLAGGEDTERYRLLAIKSYHVSVALWHACDKGCNNVADYLIKNHADSLIPITSSDLPNSDSDQKMAQQELAMLAAGAEVGEFSSIRESINDQRRKDLAAILFSACRGGHLEIAQLLVQHLKVPPQATGEDGFTPLFIACVKGHVPVVKFLVEEGKVDTEQPDKSMGATALHLACAQNQLNVVSYLVLQGGANVESRDKHRRTPLWTASAVGNLEVVEFLVSVGGADVNAVDDTEFTPLEAACKAGHLEIVKFFLIKTTTEQKRIARILYVASQEGYLDLVRFLISDLRLQANMPDEDFPDLTPLSVACSSGHIHIVRYLVVEAGVDPDSGPLVNNDFELTPLRIACHHGRLEIVKFLVGFARATIDPFCQGLARSNNYPQVAEWLDLVQQWTRLQVSCSIRDTNEIIRELRQGADPTQRDRLGISAFDLGTNSEVVQERPWIGEQCERTAKVIIHAMQPWSLESNYVWPDEMRQSARVTMLLEHRLANESDLPRLPHEIWLHVLLMLSQQITHYNNKNSSSNVNTTTTTNNNALHDPHTPES